MKIGMKDCQDLERALSLEWLEQNGRGGFASGTVAGAHTRRYHALLLTARKPPSERFVLVNHLEEWLAIDGQVVPQISIRAPSIRPGMNIVSGSPPAPGRSGRSPATA